MSRYQELLNKRAELKREGLALHQAAEREGRGLTDAEKARDDAIFAEIEGLDTEISAMEAEREAERTRVTRQAVYGSASVPAVITGGHDRRSDDPRGGFSSLAEFAVSVRNAMRPDGMAVVDERLKIGAAPTTFFQEQGGVSGEGYLVPVEYRQQIWQLVYDDPIIDRLNWENTNSSGVALLADETTPWGTSGVTARWRAEGTQMTPQRFTVEPRITRLHELYAFILATEEFLQDAPLMESRMVDKAAGAIAWKVVEAVFTGTGAGQPLGVLNSPALVSVAKETSQPADTIVAENVLKMYSRALPRELAGAFWAANSDVLPQLPTMTIGTQPVWLPPNGLAGAPNGGMLLGLPLVLNEHSLTLGDKGDIMLFAPRGYHAIRRTTAPQFASSIHLYFDYGIQAFRWMFRVGGQPFLSAAVSPAKGSATKSHFVTLDARA